MESLVSVSPSVILSTCSTNHSLPLRNHCIFVSASRSRNKGNGLLIVLRSSSFGFSCSGSSRFVSRRRILNCKSSLRTGGGEDDDNDDGRSEEVERALHLDGTIPGTSDEFVRTVSSRAYDMRSHLQQTFDTSSYDVLDSNPWREDSKPVYVLTQRENQLCTMKTRRNRSEVEKELGLLFSGGIKNKAKQPRDETKFQMLVEDIREGVLVFEDANDAVRYCGLLQGGGQVCEGVAEIEASSVFDLCRKSDSLAVLFRRGRTPPLPQTLERNLRSRRRSLED